MFGIAKLLTEEEIPTPGGSKKWRVGNIKSILTNEKYKGDALLQKTFTVDFLTKEKKKNEGEIPQYYVTGNHEPIIPVATFNRVQRLIEQRAKSVGRPSYVSVYSSKIKCGYCGGWYGSKVWHSNSKYRQVIWQCNHKFQEKCTTPNLTEKEIQESFVKAVNQLVQMKKEIIQNHQEMMEVIFDTSTLKTEQEQLETKLNEIAVIVNQCINENAKLVQNQDEYEAKYTQLVNRFNTTQNELDKVKKEMIEKESRRDDIVDFINQLQERELLTEFDEQVWRSMVKDMTVYEGGRIEFHFLDGGVIRF